MTDRAVMPSEEERARDYDTRSDLVLIETDKESHFVLNLPTQVKDCIYNPLWRALDPRWCSRFVGIQRLC